MANPRAELIARMARQRGLDPNAVLAIASVEGGFNGAVGDNGTSFGPFQLHKGGALPSVANPQQFANSPQGYAYALDAIQKVAGGLKGQKAIAAIASKFERPADVQGEIAKASSRYGGAVGSGLPVGGGVPALSPQGGSAPVASPVLGLLQAMGQTVQGQQNPLLQLALSRFQLQAATSQFGAQPSTGSKLTPQGPSVDPGFQAPLLQGAKVDPGFFTGTPTKGEDAGFLTKLAQASQAAGATKIRVTSGRRSAEHNSAVGGVQNSNHLTGHALDGEAYVPGRGWVPLGTLLKKVAPRYGLRSGDQPGFFNGGTDPVHVDDGFNLRGSA